ncbi:Uncharacterized membrane protein [Sporobacter termitidis DSM 10068]|uniref:Uncharacterized membrane protein n=1 Tax=Sporobacter termitidis DSM 10068 TaxID=1123282 RepID=A0A1M5Z939_9FIRM|nr:DUF1634 domain-containing protein [Sporobacter termitidis]SHI20740.1 Uncharacterized membrane protein [Sporobacter termitidis DSM 10068]
MKKDIERTELTIAKLLKAGVLLSAAIILIGLVLYLATGTGGYGGDAFPTDPLVILQGLAAFKPYAIILLGLFILILTPILRVGVSVIVFIREKDSLYVAITTFVFLVLIVSLLLGKVE